MSAIETAAAEVESEVELSESDVIRSLAELRQWVLGTKLAAKRRKKNASVVNLYGGLLAGRMNPTAAKNYAIARNVATARFERALITGKGFSADQDRLIYVWHRLNTYDARPIRRLDALLAKLSGVGQEPRTLDVVAQIEALTIRITRLARRIDACMERRYERMEIVRHKAKLMNVDLLGTGRRNRLDAYRAKFA